MKRYTLYIIALVLLLLCGCADASAEAGALASSVGHRIKVEYSGQIALSYPGQIFGVKVSLVAE